MQRQRRGRRRTPLFTAVLVVIAAMVAALALTSQPGYSGFEVIGKQPAVVEVFLPG
jgi:hypothetical protein